MVRFSILVMASSLLLAGCAPKNPRQEVSGTITLKGVPLDSGTIEFVPIAGTTVEGVASTAGGAIIKNGKYLIEREAGLVPAKYKVMITSGDEMTPSDPDEMPGPSGNFVMRDRIPPNYNVDSTVEREVKDTEKNEFDFDIP